MKIFLLSCFGRFRLTTLSELIYDGNCHGRYWHMAATHGITSHPYLLTDDQSHRWNLEVMLQPTASPPVYLTSLLYQLSPMDYFYGCIVSLKCLYETFNLTHFCTCLWRWFECYLTLHSPNARGGVSMVVRIIWGGWGRERSCSL
jgi:hypothetical protein